MLINLINLDKNPTWQMLASLIDANVKAKDIYNPLALSLSLKGYPSNHHITQSQTK